MSKLPQHLWISCASFALAAGVAAPALAQSNVPADDQGSATSGEDIIVTGSRIRRSPLEQDAPIVFVDQQDIAKTGLNSVNDVLQRLPSSGGGLNGKFNNSGNLGNPPDGGGVGAGSAEIDLRYLGSRRVLVLVDGIRYVNGASASGVPGSTDLNSIPESAIERVEVLQDGASSIYGSDAIAGVVNIITKKQQEGLMAAAQIGLYDRGDGATQNYQLSWGNGGDGPLKIVIGGNYVKQEGVSAGARDISRFPAPYSDTCADGGCSGFLPNGRYQVFGQDLTLSAPVLNRVSTPGDFRAFVSPDDRFNFGPYNYLQIPVERYGVFGNLRYEISDAVNFSTKLIWNQRKSKNQAAPLPFGIGQAAGLTPVLDATTVHATNPFNPFGVTLDASNTDLIYRRFVEGGPRRFNQTVDTFYGVATLDGDFAVGEGNWYWDVNAAYGKNKAKQTMFGNINSNLLRQALGPIANCTNPCVPFNLFGGAGSITQAMMDFVTFEQHDSSENELWDFTGNITGSLFTLPGGDLGIAAGVEYRDLSGRFDPDPIVAAGFSSDIPALPTRGSYSVWEGYAELNAPLLADTSFFQLLELTGAVRFSDYSTSGSTWTFKGGVNWKPIDDLRLRASYAEGFRAPSIGELFGTQSRFDQQLDDPCSSHPGNTAPLRFQNDATVRANCVAAGVPANGSYQQANPQISVLVGGNDDLDPETSESWIFGGVYSPSYFPGFSIEANYYDIKVRGAIQSIDAEVTVTNCMVSNDPTACALVTRAGAGQLTQVVGLLQNIAGINTDGLDVNLTYRTGETGAGRFGFTWNNTFLFNYDVIVPTAGGTQVISREGTEQGSPSQGFPEWKSIGIIDWDKDDFGMTLTGRYVSELDEAGGNVMKDRFYTDVQFRLTVGEDKDFGFALGVNNIFNTTAPGCVTCDINNFDPTTYDLNGRYLYAKATFKM
ncbi:TonB-dependent receptor domain-containing protein [Sphingomonas sp. LaA6.9]|uniref:TonB-dependent receptor domain-containing protein n=1 Tax=Sphingomonas sp. LaA6.9 TaxID=2919914 RepID=UPI001F4FE3B1|nr:TonB-dependent receptor [Sphingomonas sp. LaA6.9]MCJ8157415.1 TonB-dependent receptor [Sphingomonas sp. LaA6.9]